MFGGPGKATLSFRTLPVSYKDLAEWIFAGKKLALESVESKITVRNIAVSSQGVTLTLRKDEFLEHLELFSRRDGVSCNCFVNDKWSGKRAAFWAPRHFAEWNHNTVSGLAPENKSPLFDTFTIWRPCADST